MMEPMLAATGIGGGVGGGGGAGMAGLTVLSAMVTPAILILASGSLLATTSQRMGRVVERARTLSDRLEEMARPEHAAEDGVLRDRATLFDLLGRAAHRAKMLQRAMGAIVMALAVFVATSVALGLLAALDREHLWFAIPMALVGVGLLLYATVLLFVESRLLISSVNLEMAYVLRKGGAGLPREVVRTWVRETGVPEEDREGAAEGAGVDRGAGREV